MSRLLEYSICTQTSYFLTLRDLRALEADLAFLEGELEAEMLLDTQMPDVSTFMEMIGWVVERVTAEWKTPGQMSSHCNDFLVL